MEIDIRKIKTVPALHHQKKKGRPVEDDPRAKERLSIKKNPAQALAHLNWNEFYGIYEPWSYAEKSKSNPITNSALQGLSLNPNIRPFPTPK